MLEVVSPKASVEVCFAIYAISAEKELFHMVVDNTVATTVWIYDIPFCKNYQSF